MTITGAEIAAYVAAAAALLNAIAALWWGKQFKEAKNAEIEALRTQLTALAAAKDETIRAKASQIEAIRQELEATKLFTSGPLTEHFRTMKAGLEDALRSQVEEARVEAAAHQARIQQLKTEGETRAGEIQRLTAEKEEIESLAATLAFKVEDLEKQPDKLFDPDVYQDVYSSSSALANSVTSAASYRTAAGSAMDEMEKTAAKIKAIGSVFDPLLQRMKEQK